MPDPDSTAEATVFTPDSRSQSWSLDISDSQGFWRVPVREIWNYRDLLYLLVHRDFVALYKQTILGPIWFFVQPLLTAFTYYVIFGQIANISTEGAPKILFYLTGVTFWNYFAECFMKTSDTFVSNAALFGKVYFPRLIMPLSIVASSLLRFFVQFLLFVAVWLWFVIQGEVKPNAAILLFPLHLILMGLIGLGFGLMFAATTTKYRDLRFVIQFAVQLLMYATPIIYPLSIAEGKWRNWIEYNPLTALFESIRFGWLGIGDPSTIGLAVTCGFGLLSLALGVLAFEYAEQSFIDTI
jgi:lipopolysaccharide transport system permease protein